jgi:phosphatidylglycerophosphate synthase
LPGPDTLAFKAYEIEELADVYFFRPCGLVFAYAARALRLTPTTVTLVGAAVGIAGGVLLADSRLALAGFALIVLHSILDSSDGQLARMTGQTSEFGRLLDGVGGYAVYIAIYVALLATAFAHGADGWVIAVAIAAAVSNIAHAQMYDYHRESYIRCAIRGVAASAEPEESSSTHAAIIRLYESMQRRLCGTHHRVERAISERSVGGSVRAEDRERYRASFYRSVRAWNLMGDNTRFYAIGVLAWMGRLDWFFAFLLLPMNAAFVALWLYQARADRRFLAGL